ncbi:MAG: hypothetical protein QW193_04805 [Nitrososphaerales archaeon]
MDQSLNLEEVLEKTSRVELYAEPILNHISSPWIALRSGALAKLKTAIGSANYKAHEGAGLTPREVFIVEVLNYSNDYLIVKNVKWERAKTEVSKEITAKVETKVVYPVLFGKEVHKWKIEKTKSFYSVILYDQRTGIIFSESAAKIRYPDAYSFLTNFKEQFLKAANYKQFGKGKPFFFIYRVGKHTFAPFKVVWREVGTKVNAAVIGDVTDPFLGNKTIIPDYTCVYIPLNNKEEAHYLCTILNSSISRCITSYIHLHPDPHILDYVKVFQYNSNDALHRNLAELSKQAHELATKDEKEGLAKVEEEIDSLVAQLYGLTDEELKDIRESLRILEGKVAETEEVEKEVSEEAKPKGSSRRTLEGLIRKLKEES